ncbi:GIP [Symbiodinium sp. CCMP2592]|nr:GIP [Symbiodinium sp. CCMP2592]
MAPMKKLISRNTKGQYRKIDYGRVKTIKGKKYDRTILKAADIAVKGAGDGRISQKDARMICRACRPTTDGRSSYSAIEKATMAYVRKTYKFTKSADTAVRTFISKMGAKQGRKENREMAAATSVAKSKEGVPCWDGTPASFEEYSEQVMIYEQSTPFHKRYLVGPRLLGELQGAAKRHVAGQPATWLSNDQGVETLLRHLRACLGKPQIPELTEYLNRYFRQGRRKQNESMNEYIARKCELYLRACQAMARVAPHHQVSIKDEARTSGTGGSAAGQWSAGGGWPERSRRSSWDSQMTYDDGEENTPAPVQAAAPMPNSTSATTETPASEAGTQPTTEDAWSWGSAPWWQSPTWYWSDWSSYGYGQQSWWRAEATAREARHVKLLPELLPEFVQGWYLLQDAGLSASEKNLVMTAIRNDFSVQRVAQELRTQFLDIEHRRHDGAGKHAGYWGEDMDEEETENPNTEDGFSVEDLDEEDQVLWAEAEAEAQQAWAVVQTARRTLKDARARQNAVKLSRKYYKPNGGGGKGGGAPRFREDLQCLKCGRKGHRTQDCRSGGASSSSSGTTTQSAPFVCYSYEEQALSAQTPDEQAWWSTKEAVREGYAVVDGGATRTLGSVEAIHRVMELNSRKHGSNRVISVNTENRPTFGFGNATEDQCASTVEMGITAGNRPGQLTIHALDRGETPILLSVSTLRSLKAIIDFEQDLVCFRAIDPQKILKLERSNTGHQLISLTDDLFEKAKRTRDPVPSLREFVQNAAE